MQHDWYWRRLFLTEGGYVKSLLGLGWFLVEAGDQVWMLRGGGVLYILGLYFVGGTCSASTLDLTGSPSDMRDYLQGTVVYRYIGECLMVGLMDGEMLDMMGEHPTRPRPSPLKNMDENFRTITLV